MKQASDTRSASRLPKVSIVLPTYNRADFLPDAFAAIRAQTYTNWELIIVDDGSTDDTDALLIELKSQLGAQLKTIAQPNQGAYAARNTGVRFSSGEFIAFYDSDDCWHAHHLQACMNVFKVAPTVSWVYGSQRGVDKATGKVLFESSFYTNGVPRSFLKLKTRTLGDANIITDPRVLECALAEGLYCPLQNSIIRKKLFQKRSFDGNVRNGGDRIFSIVQAFDKQVFAYLNDVHVDYVIHDSNSSSIAKNLSSRKKIAINKSINSSYDRLKKQLALNHHQRKIVDRRNALNYWQLGYRHRDLGEPSSALKCFWEALRREPTQYVYWKSTISGICRLFSPITSVSASTEA